MGELVLEALLSSTIDTITDLNLGGNWSWFQHPDTNNERFGNVDLLLDLITKQAVLHHINLSHYIFSSKATKAILK